MRWFRGNAAKQFKNKFVVRKEPKAPKAPTPKQKSPTMVKKLPKIKKPIVDIPFVDAVLESEAASWTDESPSAVAALMQIMAKHKIRIKKISWKLNEARSARDDDGWCATLSGRTWTSFPALWAAASGKPAEWKRKDDKRRGRFPAQSIMGVSHAGCECHLSVEMNNGDVYGIYSTSSEPAPEVGGAEDMESHDEEAPPEAGTPGASSWMHGRTQVVSMERVEDELGSYAEDSLW